MNRDLDINTQSTPEIPGNEFQPELISDPLEILRRWGDAIDQTEAGDPIIFRTMFCRDGQVMKYITPHLEEAVKRGVKPKIILDPISYFAGGNEMPSILRHIPIPGKEVIANDYQNNKAMLEYLREAGIEIELSRPETLARQIFPYSGGDHIKGTRIGNKFWFGDKNLEDFSFFNLPGFVVEFENPELVDELTQVISSTTSPGKNEKIPIESMPGTFVLQDAGVKGSSIIYDHALDIVKQENEFVGLALWFLPEGKSELKRIFPFLPDGKLFEELTDAKRRGADVQAIASRQKVFRKLPPYYFINRYNAKTAIARNSPVKLTFAPGDGVHAKYVITPSLAEFGTNNHSEWGINAGTAELAIQTDNPVLVAQIRDFHDRLMDASRAGVRMYPTIQEILQTDFFQSSE